MCVCVCACMCMSVCVSKLAWGHCNFSLRNFSSWPHPEREGVTFSLFVFFFRWEELRYFPRYPHLIPSTPGPLPGISGISGGFLQLVSDWAVPGTASTRPWSSHLWRKERPNSRGHAAGSGKRQGGSYRVEHGGQVVSSWGFWEGGR